MTLDEQIGQALARVLSSLGAHLESDLRGFTQELSAAAAAERTRAFQAAEAAAGDVRRQAEAQVVQLREATQRQTEELCRTAEAQVADIRAALERQLEEARRTAQEHIEEAKQSSQAQVDESRRAAEAEIHDARRLAQEQVDEVQRLMNERLADMRREMEAQLAEVRRLAELEIEKARGEVEHTRRSSHTEAEEIITAQLAEVQSATDRQITDAVERARTDAHQAELANAARLMDAIRTLDQARSLGEVLDALVQCAAREVDRAAVLVVKADGLRGWRLANFQTDAASARAIALDLDAAGILGAVVRTAKPAAGLFTAATGGGNGTGLPPFARTSESRHAVALPIAVGGQVVAVLYADSPRSDTPSAASRWPAILEVLARHASRMLEALTVQRATGLTPPNALASPSRGVLPGPVEHGTNGEEDAARRYARLLVSEIRMYHEPIVDAGRRSRDLRTRLGGEIDRARRLYEARVPAAVREKSDLFEQELVRTLADGDRSLLG